MPGVANIISSNSQPASPPLGQAGGFHNEMMTDCKLMGRPAVPSDMTMGTKSHGSGSGST